MHQKNKPFSWRNICFTVFSLGVTLGVFTYLFREISLDEIKDIIIHTQRSGIVLFVLLSISMSTFRTWRYFIVLRVSGFRPGKIALFLTTLVRNFFSDLLPARIGTLIYIYIVNTRLGIPFGAAASSFVLPFLFDMIAIVPLVFLAFLAMGTHSLFSPFLTVLAAMLLLIFSIFILYFLPAFGRYFARLFSRVPCLFKAFNDAANELDTAKKARIYGQLLWLSIAVRVTKYSSMYFLLYAMLAPKGYTLQDLPLHKIFIGLLLPEFAASTPISGIGGFGAYEGVWTFTFIKILNYPENLAKVTSIAHHLLTQCYGWSLGAIATLLLLLSFKKSHSGK